MIDVENRIVREVGDEKFAAGERLEAFDSARLGRVGLLICEDLWHLSVAGVMQARTWSREPGAEVSGNLAARTGDGVPARRGGQTGMPLWR